MQNRFFKNRNLQQNLQLQTFKQALPRTIAPITAVAGAKTGFAAGCRVFP